MFKKFILFTALAVNIAGICGDKEQINKPVLLNDGPVHKCKAETSKDSLVICQSRNPNRAQDIFNAIARCSNQSQDECNAAIKHFMPQFTQRESVACYNRLCYVNREDDNTRNMTPLELAAITGSVKAVLALFGEWR